MTQDELVAIGEGCERLMRDHTFNWLTSHFERGLFEEFAGSTPDQKSKRDVAHASIYGVRMFLNMMSGFVEVKNQITNPEEFAPSPDDGDA